MFQGVYTALATPMAADGKIDYPALDALLKSQLQAGVDGLVLLGTTAETPTLSAQEKNDLLRFCMERVAGKTKIIIGTGANSTTAALENTRAAAAFHPDGVLVVTPYYNKPNLSGLTEHFRQIATVGLPVVLYHIPGRTGLKLSAGQLDTLLKEVPQIAGIKEADYDLARIAQTAVSHADKKDILCGNDDLFPAYLALGARGIISAAANILAPAFVQMYKHFFQGAPQKAFDIFAHVYPLVKACYAETNPTCIKYMLGKFGYGTQAVRLPLGEITPEHKREIDNLLKNTDPAFLIKGNL